MRNGHAIEHNARTGAWEHSAVNNGQWKTLGKGIGAKTLHEHLQSVHGASTGDAHEGFAKLDHSLAHRKGVKNAAALAAWIGRRKEGKAAFQAKAAAGR